VNLRIDSFELRAFGPFTGTVLELATPTGTGLHVITGPNEIGKSTSKRGIGDFLFGIPVHSTDNQLHGYNDMRLAAVLVDEAGKRYELVRRKGARYTLLGPDGTAVDEGIIDSMLGGMTREIFESMFSLTHESLVTGGKALLAADGGVGESLFSASLGAAGLHELRATLEREAGELYRPRATSSRLLRAHANYEDAQRQLREATLRARTFTEHERLLREASGRREALDEEVREARAAQRTRQRLRTVIPMLVQLDEQRVELDGLADVPDLPADATERRVRAAERSQAERRKVADAEQRVSDLERRVAALSPATDLLERELAIKSLEGRVANVTEGSEDLERQNVKLQTATGLAERALREIRPDLSLDEADFLRMSHAQRSKVDRALDSHVTLVARIDAAEGAARSAEDGVKECEAELASLAEPLDASLLAAVVAEAQADAQIEERLEEAARAFEEATRALEAALRDVRPAATADALEEMTPPSAEAAEAFADELADLNTRTRELADQRLRLDDERRELDESATSMALTTNVPTLEDLGAARAERDGHWSEVRRQLDGGAPATVAPDAFEGELRRADDVADRLREDADAVAKRAQLTVRERRLAADEHALEECEKVLAAERTDHERRWLLAWEPTGLKPDAPRAMSAWLRARGVALERAELVARCNRALELVERRRDEHVAALRGQLTVLGVGPDEHAGLGVLLRLAGERVADSAAFATKRAGLERDIQLSKATASAHRGKATEHRAALDGWQASWNELVAANGWPSDTRPDDARAVLSKVDELSAALHDVEQVGARVRGIRDRIASFERDAAGVFAEVAPELASWPVQDGVAELARRLHAAIETRSRRETLAGELDTARAELETAHRVVGEAADELAALAELAGVATAEELPVVERDAARARVLRDQLPALERQIAEAGQAPLRELAAATAHLDVDALDAGIEDADVALAAFDHDLHELDMRVGELRVEQRKMEERGGAADAAAEVERHVAELRELTERYLHTYLAEWALSEAIDSYQREHKAPLLKRAGELFPQITCKQFASLDVRFDNDDEPALVGVRPSGERVSVAQMSTGAKEQLYLSLRIASLERHMELHGPMPVIFDDVVLHSDPQRKAEILGALGELAKRTQVIAFTHDPQVVALAQAGVDPNLLTIHELGSKEIAGARHPQIAPADVRPIRTAQAA
jgi:uncharacterized protein YhaN